MLAKNYHELIVNGNKLDYDKSDYLIALRDGFLRIQRDTSFYIEPYNPN